MLTATLEATVTVTSLDTIGPPQVGVEVQTIYQVPVVKTAPVGEKVAPVAPDIAVIAPPEADRFPHWRLVIVPPPVSVTVKSDPVPVVQIVWAVEGVVTTAERFALTMNAPDTELVTSAPQAP